MKGKLHKMVSGYILSLNGDIDDPYAIVNEELAKDYEWYKLSIKNCQAIELGYDLDEEVSNIVKTIVPDDRGTDIWYGTSMAVGKLCFQKALELMGDKKFSEEQLREAFFHVQNEPTFDEFIQSLQQTEWDVEVVMVPAMSNNGNVYYGDIPKLDENGCLILKKL